MPIIWTRDHHGSHRDLLWIQDDPGPAGSQIEAIIVPAARKPSYLAAAAALAKELGCTLVTLHSKNFTSAAEAAQYLSPSVDLIAIDVPDPGHLTLPELATSRMLAGTIFGSRTDQSIKRNLGLVLSRMLGWSRVFFLDDDITMIKSHDVRHASARLDMHNAVGLFIGDFPDHSVVCHAYRQFGGPQQSFIGGGALAVQVERANSFFPAIYNEDWFFFLDGKGLHPVAAVGQVAQYPYDPFRSPDRASSEELGEVLAEGIYWLLDQHKSIADADHAHWSAFLKNRKNFIQSVIKMVEEANISHAERAHRITALKASLARLAHITPQLCQQYMQAWASDLERWRDHMAALPAGLPRQSAFAALTRRGSPMLDVVTRYSYDAISS